MILGVSELCERSLSEYLLLAAVVEVAVRTVTLTNLLLFRWCTCVGFVQIVVALAIIEGW